MAFTVINHTDLTAQAARLRAAANRIERGGYRDESERVLAHRIGAILNEAGQKVDEARSLLPQTGLDFHGDEGPTS